jgi:hypothetical protein
MVGGPDGHRGSVTESSLVVRWTRGDSNLHREGEKVGCVTAETSSILACFFGGRRGRQLREASAAAITVLV